MQSFQHRRLSQVATVTLSFESRSCQPGHMRSEHQQAPRIGFRRAASQRYDKMKEETTKYWLLSGTCAKPVLSFAEHLEQIRAASSIEAPRVPAPEIAKRGKDPHVLGISCTSQSIQTGATRFPIQFAATEKLSLQEKSAKTARRGFGSGLLMAS